MRGERAFYNEEKKRTEVWLHRGTFGKVVHWWVTDIRDEQGEGTHYPDTDQGYAKAYADYESRVAAMRKMEG